MILPESPAGASPASAARKPPTGCRAPPATAPTPTAGPSPDCGPCWADSQTIRACSVGSLGGDNPDLASLITTVEKMIFDQPVDIQARRKPSHQPEPTRTVESQELGSLAVQLADTQRHKRRYRRLVSSGDLAHLLDVLIHHLGVGLQTLPGGVDSQGRSEEEQIWR